MNFPTNFSAVGFCFSEVQEPFNWFLYFFQGQFVCIVVKLVSPSGKDGLGLSILPSCDITPGLDVFFLIRVKQLKD